MQNLGLIYPNRIEGQIHAETIDIGVGVVIEPGVVISGKYGPAKHVRIGDFVYIGKGAHIRCPEFVIGHYSRINADTFCGGDKPLQIGRNCYIGGKVRLDSNGGLDLMDGVGIGDGSQLWTHIQFGDVVQGCRFDAARYMQVGQDAWFVGHCLVSPVHVAARSMAMLGSVITKDMAENHVYAGVPARDITDKVGPQFGAITLEQKQAAFDQLLENLMGYSDGMAQKFNVAARTYHRTYDPSEVAFMQAYAFLAKFRPSDEPELFFVPQAEVD